MVSEGDEAITAEFLWVHVYGSHNRIEPSLKEVAKNPPKSPKQQSTKELLEHLMVLRWVNDF